MLKPDQLELFPVPDHVATKPQSVAALLLTNSEQAAEVSFDENNLSLISKHTYEDGTTVGLYFSSVKEGRYIYFRVIANRGHDWNAKSSGNWNLHVRGGNIYEPQAQSNARRILREIQRGDPPDLIRLNVKGCCKKRRTQK